MKRKHIQYLEGYVSAIAALTKYVTDSQMDFSLRSVKTAGEMLFPSSRRFFEDILHCKVFESYGTQEFGEIALECQEHSGLHIYDESFVVEVIRDGEAVVGEEGEIAITDLRNFAQPFIRYLVGDRGIISDEPCSCGRTLSILHSVSGRCNDTVLSPSGIWVSSAVFDRLLRPLDEIIQWQIEQQSKSQLLARLVVYNQNPSLESYIRSSLAQIDPAFVISFEYLEKIPKTSAGKLKCVISPFTPRVDLVLSE